MRKINKKKLALALCVIATLQLAGCGKKESNIDEFGMTENTKQQVSDETVEGKKSDSAEDKYGIKGSEMPNHITCNLEKDAGLKSLEIDADVISEGYRDAKVYAAKTSVLSEEEFKAFADSFFDNGKYESVLPYDYWSDEDRAAERAKLEEMVSEAGPEYKMHDRLSSKLGYDSNRVPASEQQPLLEPEDGKLFYHIDREEEGDYIFKEKFAYLRGTVDGLEYELEYLGDDDGYSQTISIIPLFPITKSIGYGMYASDLSGEENTGDTSALENKANELVKAMTGNYVMSSSEDRACYSEKENKYFYDGKIVHFSLNLPDLSPSLCEGMFAGKKTTREMVDEQGNGVNDLFFKYDFVPQQYINVEMDANGTLLSLDYDNAMVPGEAVGESVQMLEFKEVMKCLDTFLDGFEDPNGEYSNWDSEEICEVRLTYLIELSDGVQVYMPYWVFLTKNKRGVGNTGTPYLGTFGVNAIDGNVAIMKYYPRY